MSDTYADGTFGHNGTEPSQDAAESERVREVTRESMKEALEVIANTMAYGSTSKELEDFTGRGHGRVSSALTNLHRMGHLVALRERRGNQTVYVAPEYVNGRETRPYRRSVPKPRRVTIDEISELPSYSILLADKEQLLQGYGRGYLLIHEGNPSE